MAHKDQSPVPNLSEHTRPVRESPGLVAAALPHRGQAERGAVWLVKAYGPDRAYAGNEDHEDNLPTTYRYTNFVPNHLQVKVGDVFLLRGKRGLLGVARIGRIETEDVEEVRRRCPSCQTTNIKLRQKGHFTCQRCNDKFYVAKQETVKCTRYSASYEGSFVALPQEPSFSDEAIRKASPRFNAQNAIIPIDPGVLEVELRRVAPGPALELLGLSPSTH